MNFFNTESFKCQQPFWNARGAHISRLKQKTTTTTKVICLGTSEWRGKTFSVTHSQFYSACLTGRWWTQHLPRLFSVTQVEAKLSALSRFLKELVEPLKAYNLISLIYVSLQHTAQKKEEGGQKTRREAKYVQRRSGKNSQELHIHQFNFSVKKKWERRQVGGI